MGGYNVLHQPLVHVHLLRQVESHSLQQFTLILLRPLESFLHLEGILLFRLPIFEEVVLFRW